MWKTQQAGSYQLRSRTDNVKSRKSFRIVLAAVNAGLSLLALLLPNEYPVIVVIVSLSFAIFAIICLLEVTNLLFLARTFILGFIGYFPMAVKVILGQDALFSPYEPSTQGFDIVVIMYVTTSFALLSNAIGLTAASPRGNSNGIAGRFPIGSTCARTHIERVYWQLAAVMGVVLTIASSAIFVSTYGGPIFTIPYGAATGELPFGTVGVLGSIGIFSIFVAGLKRHIRHWKALLLVAGLSFVVYAQLLMGLRQDAMSTLFGLVVLYGVVNGKTIGLKPRYVPLIVISYVFFEAWGVARTAVAMGDSLPDIVATAFTSMDASGVVSLGTASPIATTFANVVYLVKHQIIDHSFGLSYLEWLLRIPPEILYPDRPQDYAWMFSKYGLSAAGGFFELAEVYMNFGLLGALFVPGIVSYVMAKVYWRALKRQTLISYFLLFAFLAVFLRGTWYQTFAFFKALLVCVLLSFIYTVMAQVIRLCGGGHSSIGATTASP